MDSFQPLLGGADNAQPNNENRLNYGGGSGRNNAPSYGSLKQQSNNNNNNSRDVPQSPFPPMGRLPPLLRQRANSSGDRSASEISTLSGRSGLSNNQRVRSVSPMGNNGNYGAPPLASRKVPQPPPLDGSGRSVSSGSSQNNVVRPHPLFRSASAASSSSNRHRTMSSDSGFKPPHHAHRRQSSSGSVFSLSSQDSGAMSPEAVKLLPDPRWGGGGGGAANRARSFSSGSHARRNTFSNFSEGLSGGSDFDYGSLQGLSIGNFDLAPSAAGKKKHHRRNSSIGSYASIVSVDQSVDPVTTNMSKSSMLKEVTHKGVLRMQLPKDQFRLLSDRDLGKFDWDRVVSCVCL